MLSFSVTEQLTGSFYRLDSPGEEQPLEMTAEIDVPDLRRFVIDPVAELKGQVSAASLCEAAPIRGTLTFDPIDRHLRYEFRVDSSDDPPLTFSGDKELVARDPVGSLTVLHGSFFLGDEELGRAVLRFRLRKSIRRFLSSIRAGGPRP
ncbi:MAG: hypothetical protein AAGF12_38085 [Myxococcota bacterium]